MDQISKLVENLKRFGNLEWIIATLEEDDDTNKEDSIETVNQILESELSYYPGEEG